MKLAEAKAQQMPARMIAALQKRVDETAPPPSSTEVEEAVEAEAAPIAPLEPIHSVKVQVLDEEHERCEAALAQLKKLRNVTALRELLAAYETHLNPDSSPSHHPWRPFAPCTLHPKPKPNPSPHR